MDWIGEIFPPLSTLLAAIIPGGRLGLGVAGALVAGVFLQKMLEIMVQRKFSPWLASLLLIALAANPLFAYTATENFAAFLGLAFFGLGIADIVRFVAWGNTQSGFRAGIYLMLATLSDLSGLVYVLTAAAAAPFLRLGRRASARSTRGKRARDRLSDVAALWRDHDSESHLHRSARRCLGAEARWCGAESVRVAWAAVRSPGRLAARSHPVSVRG